MKTVELLNFVLVIKYFIQNPNDVQSESFNILGLASLPVKPKRPRWLKNPGQCGISNLPLFILMSPKSS